MRLHKGNANADVALWQCLNTFNKIWQQNHGLQSKSDVGAQQTVFITITLCWASFLCVDVITDPWSSWVLFCYLKMFYLSSKIFCFLWIGCFRLKVVGIIKLKRATGRWDPELPVCDSFGLLTLVRHLPIGPTWGASFICVKVWMVIKPP